MKTAGEIVSPNLVYCITVDLFGSNLASFADASAKRRREEIIGSNTIEYNMEKTVTVVYMKWKFNFIFENRTVCLECSMKKMKTFNSRFLMF